MKVIVGVLRFGLGLALVLGAVATSAFATPVVPEISIDSIGSAVALLSGGYLVLTARFRRTK